MNPLRHFRRNAIAYLALMLALGSGSAVAAGKIGGNRIAKDAIRSRHIKDGQIGSADVRDGSLQAADFAAGAMAAGMGSPPGPEGAPGPRGPEGEPATALWAVVNPDGSLSDGSGALESMNNGDSRFYAVRFDRDVSHCAAVASVGGGPGYDFSQEGIASVYPVPPNPVGGTGLVQVSTHTIDGEPAQLAFHVAVFC